MPTDACALFYTCEQCKSRIKPTEGDCCVFAATVFLFTHLSNMGKAAAKDLFMAIHVNDFSYVKD